MLLDNLQQGKLMRVLFSAGRQLAAVANATAACVTLAAIGVLLLLSPSQVAASTSSPRAYVTNFLANSVSIIDTSTNAVVVTVGVGARPVALAVTPDGSLAYVANSNSSNVSVIATDSVVATIGVGSFPVAVAITPDGKHAYVANFNSNNVSVIDTVQNTVVATVVVGSNPAGVAITPDGKHAYVTNQNSSNVSVISTLTNTIETTVPSVTFRPGGIAITPDGAHAYVTDTSSFNVAVIAISTNTVVGGLSAQGEPFTVAISPDGKRAYTANLGAGSVSVIDTGTNAVLSNVPVGSFPRGVAVTADGSFVYVTNQGSDSLSVIDTVSDTVVATLTMTAGSQPYGIAIAPAPPLPAPPPHPPAPRAYVTNPNSGNVLVVDTGINTVVATLKTAGTSFGVAVSPKGDRAYVTNGSNNVSVIDTGSNAILGNVTVGAFPAGVAVSPDGSHVYVANHTNASFSPSTVSVIDAATNTVAATVGVGVLPWGVAITPDGSRAYVTNENSSTVSVVNTSTNTVVATVPVGFTPQGVAVIPDGSRAYVANSNSGTVSVIDTATNKVVTTVTLGGNPRYIAFSPDGSRAYVSNILSGLFIIDTATNTVISTVPGRPAYGVALTPDGTHAYVTSAIFDNLSAIDLATNTTVASVVVGVGADAVAMALPAISIDNVRVTKASSGTSDAIFTVLLSAATARTITVDFATADGSATAGNDYIAQSGTLTFNPGETSKQITVVVNGNTSFKPDQTFFVNLSNPVNTALAKAQGVGTIISTPPTITATSGTLQTAPINVAFPNPLVATVKDAGGNPLPAVTVTFSAPSTGASGTFAGGVSTAITDVLGVATSTTFTANNIAGTYTVTATTAGVVTPASFSLTNSTQPALIAVNPNTGQQGQTGLSVNLTGQFTTWAQGTTTVSFGAGITVKAFTVNSANTATALIDIDPAAAVAARNVTVTTGAEVVTLSNGFTVTSSIVIPADLTVTKVANGTFTRGQTAATYTITVNNIGDGTTTGVVTVVDTLPNLANTIVPTALSGTGWTCTLSTLTCTRSDALAPGVSYPAITLTVNIPNNIGNTFTNTVTVSGGGETNTSNDTGTSTVILGPPIIVAPQSSSATIAAGGSATFTLKVDAPDPTLGVITFSCSGLPLLASCSFSPATIDTSLGVTPVTVTMTVATTASQTVAFARPQEPVRNGLLAVHILAITPALGLMTLVATGRKRRKKWAHFALFAILSVLSLAMASCGGSSPARVVPGTPQGTSTITIKATSPGFTATSTVNLTVQ